MVRYLFPVVLAVIAVAVIVGATHELAHVLAFDWTASADATSAPVSVQLR